jgi:hypothetical protein
MLNSYFIFLFEKKENIINMSKHRFDHDIEILGNISLTGTIDGRDIASDGTTLDTHVATISAHGVAEIVGTTDSQTLTNKTITATSNNVVAKGLHSATTTISVSSATAPSSGQVLTATSSTTATWQDASSSSSQPYGETSSVATHTAPASKVDYDNTTEALNFTTATLDAGTYIIFIKWVWVLTGNNNTTCHIRLRLDSTIVFETNKSVNEDSTGYSEYGFATVTSGGSTHTIDVHHYSESTSSDKNSKIDNLEIIIFRVV